MNDQRTMAFCRSGGSYTNKRHTLRVQILLVYGWKKVNTQSIYFENHTRSVSIKKNSAMRNHTTINKIRISATSFTTKKCRECFFSFTELTRISRRGVISVGVVRFWNILESLVSILHCCCQAGLLADFSSCYTVLGFGGLEGHFLQR